MTIPLNELAIQAAEIMENGCFLNTYADGNMNSMTIGWGTIGNVWGMPIFTVMVRRTRYTHELIEKNPYFTVSIPYNKHMTKEIALFGTASGRDVNKFEQSGLKTKPAKKVNVPVIADVGIQFECEVVYKQDMDPSTIDKAIVEKYYTTEENEDKDNYHTIYYGKIVAAYLDE